MSWIVEHRQVAGVVLVEPNRDRAKTVDPTKADASPSVVTKRIGCVELGKRKLGKHRHSPVRSGDFNRIGDVRGTI